MNKAKTIINNLNSEISEYFNTYWMFHKEKYSSERIIDLQVLINERINKYMKIIEDINRLEFFEVKYKANIVTNKIIVDNYYYLINLYHLLVDDVIIKYVCDGQCSLFAQIVDDSQKNTNYNYEMVSQYLEIAKNDYCKMNQVAVISDLSSFNLNCGDIIIYSLENGFNYVEVKLGDKNYELCNMILSGKIDDNLSSNDLKHINRIKKQFSKHEKIDNEYGLPMFSSTRRFFDNTRFYIKPPTNFLLLVKKSIKKLEKDLYVEEKVDDCIDILLVNTKNLNDNVSSIMKEYTPNGKNIFSYNEFMTDSIVSRPYMLNWNKKEYYKLIFDEIIIYIKINYKIIFEKLKKYFPDLKFRKANETDYKKYKECIIDNKIVYFMYKNHEIPVGNMIFYRIASLLYTSDYSVLYYAYNFRMYFE